ncbi:hypothetical protein CDAR_218951 [Caerostris darwini]|uniref:Uncharacterized protein n=1 Tax=Caerostris darwini TaxID=1538125 RepID=A0AAV4VQJ3_9ARAC|nr:hypothetical protein CDAR_218951 [Caerostris darwini]
MEVRMRPTKIFETPKNGLITPPVLKRAGGTKNRDRKSCSRWGFEEISWLCGRDRNNCGILPPTSKTISNCQVSNRTTCNMGTSVTIFQPDSTTYNW